MIIRISQRAQEDCIICAVAMVMGHPYNYERVLRDSAKYPAISEHGKLLAWWESYLRNDGFEITYRRFLDLYEFPRFGGNIVGLLHINISHLRNGHIVAVDELGIVDPADGAKDHIEIQHYVLSRLPVGFVFDDEFLAIFKIFRRESMNPRKSSTERCR